MLLDPPLRAGDIVQLKKEHACGGNSWQVLLAGADVRLKCVSCRRVILLDRVEFKRRFRKRLSCAAQTSSPAQ